jgi:peptidoglycan/xylan/chitin deacetylase (PgdA/CDA1 family)
MHLSDYIKRSGIRLSEILLEIKATFPELDKDIFNFEMFVKMVDASTLSSFRNSRYIDFGSHTHTHYCLEYVPLEVQYQELSESRGLLEQVLKRPVVMVAYPDGSYNESVIIQTQHAGYKHAFVVNYRLSEQRTPDFYKPRFTIANSTTFQSNINRLYYQYRKFSF